MLVIKPVHAYTINELYMCITNMESRKVAEMARKVSLCYYNIRTSIYLIELELLMIFLILQENGLMQAWGLLRLLHWQGESRWCTNRNACSINYFHWIEWLKLQSFSCVSRAVLTTKQQNNDGGNSEDSRVAIIALQYKLIKKQWKHWSAEPSPPNHISITISLQATRIIGWGRCHSQLWVKPCMLLQCIMCTIIHIKLLVYHTHM